MAKNKVVVQGKTIILSEKFADVKVPEFKAERGQDWVRFGNNDSYPNEVLNMLNKSPKHNAIIGGKLTYIYGGGFKDATTAQGINFLKNVNGRFTKKLIADIEVHGGAAIECIPKRGGGYKFYHITFFRIRSNEANTKFYYKKDWNNRDIIQAKEYNAFYPGIKTRSIMYFKEYRSGLGTYPLPAYLPITNYVMADIEVSKHTYSNAKNGFAASKMISFFNGDPGEEGKAIIEGQLGLKYEGSDGKKTIVSFNDDKQKAPQVDDLGASDLTKEDFSAVDNLITSNIIIGHQVNNGILFGIQTPGKLGTATETREAYEVFNNTYAKLKREQVEGIIEYLGYCNGVTEKLELINTPPIGVTITDAMVQQALTRAEIRERLGAPAEDNPVDKNPVVKALNSLSPIIATTILEKMTDNEIRSLVNLPPIAGADILPADKNNPQIVAPAEQQMVNEHIKNLTGRQRQNMTSIIKGYATGKTPRDMAAMLLKTGLGLSDDEINVALGGAVVPEKKTELRSLFGVELDPIFLEEFTAGLFNDYGDAKDDYEVISTNKATWNINDEVREMFAAGSKLGGTKKQILSLLEKDSTMTSDSLSEALSLPVEVVKKALKELVSEKALSLKSGEYQVLKEAAKLPKIADLKVPAIEARYSYEVIPGVGKEIKPTTRPFCRELCRLNKMYLRSDIEKISQLVGYSVWDRRGGFWRKPDGSTSESCRHYWAMHIVTKKDK